MPDKPRASIVLDSPSFTFNASHFLAFPSASDAKDRPWFGEPIHGHDFKAEATVEGPLDGADCVVDFIAATQALNDALKRWRYKLILARKLPNVEYDDDGKSTTIRWKGEPREERWVYPSDRIAWLDAVNASTEAIAAATLVDFRAKLVARAALQFPPTEYRFSLRLQEAPGAWAQVSLGGLEGDD